MRELNFFRTLTHTLKSDYAHALENEKRTCAAERKNWYEEREQLLSSIQEQCQLQVYGLYAKFLCVHERTFIHRIYPFFLHRFLFTPALRCSRVHMRKFLSDRVSSVHA